MDTVTIRAAQRQDLPQLCALRDTPALFLGYLDECDGKAAHFVVAELGGKLVGFGLLYLAVTRAGKTKSHYPKLSDLYVGTAYRRGGIATALIQARERLARDAGNADVYVSIDPHESAAMTTLARRLGYQPMQDTPYAVDATYYDAGGQAYAKRYFRRDFYKRLA